LAYLLYLLANRALTHLPVLDLLQGGTGTRKAAGLAIGNAEIEEGPVARACNFLLDTRPANDGLVPILHQRCNLGMQHLAFVRGLGRFQLPLKELVRFEQLTEALRFFRFHGLLAPYLLDKLMDLLN